LTKRDDVRATPAVREGGPFTLDSAPLVAGKHVAKLEATY